MVHLTTLARRGEMIAQGWQRFGRERSGTAPLTVAAGDFVFSCSCLAKPLSVTSGRLITALRQVVAVCIAAGLLFAPLPAAFTHGPQALSAPESHGHSVSVTHQAADHSHGQAGHEPAGGHIHGHDPADHSHQVAFLAGGNSKLSMPAPQRWPSSCSGTPDQAMALGIERPPKQTMFV
jgi:hypothetical protein